MFNSEHFKRARLSKLTIGTGYTIRLSRKCILTSTRLSFRQVYSRGRYSVSQTSCSDKDNIRKYMMRIVLRPWLTTVLNRRWFSSVVAFVKVQVIEITIRPIRRRR